jgi:four helix bundle protein
MGKIERFEDMDVWQHSRDLCKYIFELVQRAPFCKDFSLIDQIKRSGGSVMDNIAEGFERNGNKEFITFLYYSKGSCGEVKSQLYIAFDFKYISEEEFKIGYNKADNISKELSNFIKYLKNNELKGIKYK